MVEVAKMTCGACIAFSFEGEETGKGRCRLRPELGSIAHSLAYCDKYVERGTGVRAPKKKRAVHGRGRDMRDEDDVRPSRDTKRSVDVVRIIRGREYGSSIDLGDEDMDTNALKALIRDVLREEGVTGETEIASRFEGGKLILKPASDANQSKEIPIETFFHKIVMVRDKLRVLEQKINANKDLSDNDKVDMQQYITRAYGSLTTFNILFHDKDDQFRGSSKD